MNDILKAGPVKWVLILLAVFLGITSLGALLNLRYIGAGIAATNTISVSGHGQINATPDIATFTYSIVSDKSTVAAAQADATAKSNAVTAYLKAQGIADADIQTSGYSVYPQYEYQNAVCPQTAPANGAVLSPTYCPPGKQVLTGYEASQTTTIKVHDLTKAGDLLSGVGTNGATQVSGLTFTFDDPNAPQEQAREAAIADAKAKAGVLAKELGVSLVRVVSFNESSNGNSGPVPIYAMAAGSTADKSSAPEISAGQNQVTDDVTITYEIR